MGPRRRTSVCGITNTTPTGWPSMRITAVVIPQQQQAPGLAEAATAAPTTAAASPGASAARLSNTQFRPAQLVRHGKAVGSRGADIAQDDGEREQALLGLLAHEAPGSSRVSPSSFPTQGPALTSRAKPGGGGPGAGPSPPPRAPPDPARRACWRSSPGAPARCARRGSDTIDGRSSLTHERRPRRLQQARLGRFWFRFLRRMPRPTCPLGDEGLVLPDAGQQALPREYDAGAGGEHVQQAELLPGHLHGHSPHLHGAPCRVHSTACELARHGAP